MDIGGFIGRFHPLFVHLPIGLLLLAGIFEYFARKPRYNKLHQAVVLTLFIGALSAIFSSVSGWLLANRGAYIERSLFLHRWLGIAVAVFATLCWLIKTKRLNLSLKAFQAFMILMIAGIFATGHYGGNMTHGEDYLLEYAPAFVKNIFEKEKKTKAELDVENLSSIKIYDHLLSPVFEDHCWKCHNPNNTLGGLDMTTKVSFLKGGLTGVALEKGEAYKSLVFERITLPTSNRKSMPPAGLALPYNQIKLIEWWINTGATFEKNLEELEISADIKLLLTEMYGISFLKKSAIEMLEVDAANAKDMDLIREAGFQLSEIAEGNNLLDVKAKSGAIANFEILLKAKDQIGWLDVSDAEIDDSQVTVVAQLPHLTRLNLKGTAIGNVDVQALEKLSLLESLNLIGTNITDEGLAYLKNLSSLNTVYLWQTKVSAEAIKTLQEQRPDLEVIQGFKFKEIPGKK